MRSSSGAGHADAHHRAPLAGDGRDDRELEVVGVVARSMKSCSTSSQHLVGPGVGPVDLVQHDHRRQVAGQRLRQHVAGLGQRALGRVDEQEHAVDHGQGPLHLTAEVGVARACRPG